MKRLTLLLSLVAILAVTSLFSSCGGGDDFSKAMDAKGASGGAAKPTSSTTGTSGTTGATDAGKSTTPPPAGGSTTPGAGAGGGAKPPAGGATTPPPTGATGATAQTGSSAAAPGGVPALPGGSLLDALKTPEGLLSFEELREKYPKELVEIEKEFSVYKNVNFEQIRKDKSDALWTLDEFWGTDAEGDFDAFRSNMKKYGLTEKDIPKVLYDGVGRVDPLTFVADALPEELRPPRSGETDPDAVQEYFIVTMGSIAVEEAAARMVVYNIIQVGYAYQIQTSYGLLTFDSSSGNGSSGGIPSSNGMQVSLSVVSASSNSVTFNFSEAVSGISKNKTYTR